MSDCDSVRPGMTRRAVRVSVLMPRHIAAPSDMVLLSPRKHRKDLLHPFLPRLQLLCGLQAPADGVRVRPVEPIEECLRLPVSGKPLEKIRGEDHRAPGV